MNDDLATARCTYADELAGSGGQELQIATPRRDSIAVALYASPAYALSVPPLPVARLSINLSRSSVTGGLDSDRPRTYLTRRHSLFLTPAGASATWRKASSSRHITIYFHASASDALEDSGSASHPLLGMGVPLLNAALTGAGPLFEMLHAELSEPTPFAAEAVDSLARLILLRLARRQTPDSARANPLTPALQARLVEYIDARLEHRLLVADLAAVTGLSPNRFTQALTRATGRSPHQLVLQLRLQRAVQLLHHSTHSLADVAAACGFASQQHMTHVMGRHLGTTPARRRAGFTAS